ncbi:MAG TPA: FkbM family methyltransferase [Sphingomicrobium sp.]|nr:FkbM family methyltransferase [Sphingomicrobium sp.]
MIGAIAGKWAAAWKRIAPHATLPASKLTVRPFASDAPMRTMMTWKADWKTNAVAAILARRSGTFIDVGANVGQSLLDFLSAPHRSAYLGFEPNLTCYQHLAVFISENRLDSCKVIPAGLADRNGIASLYRLAGDVDSGGTILKELRPRLHVMADRCCLFKLDDLPELLPGPEIALIKIDTEGTELEVLRGMATTVRTAQPWILCEVLHRDELAEAAPYRRRSAELMRLLGELGYSVQRAVHDDTRIHVLEDVTEFPDKVWTDESVRLCDYLFVPSSDLAQSREALLA